jgi:hypothetical protein
VADRYYNYTEGVGWWRAVGSSNLLKNIERYRNSANAPCPLTVFKDSNNNDFYDLSYCVFDARGIYKDQASNELYEVIVIGDYKYSTNVTQGGTSWTKEKLANATHFNENANALCSLQPANPPTITLTPIPTSSPADKDGDGDVDWLDFKVLMGSFGGSETIYGINELMKAILN